MDSAGFDHLMAHFAWLGRCVWLLVWEFLMIMDACYAPLVVTAD
jgi:hypothetical protein